MSRPARIRFRSGAAALLLAGLVVGFPVLLVALAGWPLPDQVPAWGRVTMAIQQGEVPADVVVDGIAVVAWLIWAQLAWAAVWELTVNRRRSVRGQRPKPGPLVAPAVRTGIGRLVAVAFSIGVASTTASPALALPTTSVHIAPFEPGAATPADPSAVADHGAGHESTARWVVQPGDSLWLIAETTLGDGARATEILDLNPYLSSARDVRSGQHLALPADAAIPPDPAPATTTVAHPLVYVPPADVTVERGDNLWDLTEARLALAYPTPPTDAQILDHLDTVLGLNPDLRGHPDLIHPGDVITFPSIGTPPTSTVQPDESAEIAVEQPPSDEVGVSTAAPSNAATPPTTTTTTPPTTVAPPAASSSEEPATEATTTPVQAPTVSPVPPTAATDDRQVAPTEQSALPAIAGITGAIALSSALLLGYRRRRTRHAMTGARALRRRIPDRDLERALVASSDVPLLVWANHELAAAFRNLDRDSNATPQAVEISTDHGIEILWSEPNRHAPRPWEATDDGWAWRVLYDPDHPIPDEPTPPPMPGLVTIGQREGRQLLIDLEAHPTILIDGPDDRVRDLLRSMITELANGETLADAYVQLESQLDGVGAGPRVSRIVGAPADVVERTVTAHDQLLNHAGLNTTFQLRTTDPCGREITVLLVDELTEHVASLVRPHRGVAVLTTRLAPEVSALATIKLGDDGSALLDPLGVAFAPAALPIASSERLVALLEPTSEDPSDTRTHEASEPASGDEPVDNLDANDCQPGDLGDLDDTAAPTPPRVMVRVLGQPVIDEFPQLGRLETSIVTFIACRGGSASDEQVIDAVWNGRLVERGTVWNRISKTRRVLQELLPPREPASNSIKLHPDVRTDLAYLETVLEWFVAASTGEAITVLTGALDLVRGVPFDAPGYDWAHQHQDHARACETVETVGLRLAEIALEAGDIPSARHAVTQALKALPGNEPLYRMRMRIEAAADNPAGVRGAYAELIATLDDWGDGDAVEPTRETITLRRQLMGGES